MIYSPSYEPPPPTSGLIRDVLPSINFFDQGDGWFAASYAGFIEKGSYRVVIYAEDGEGLEAKPVTLTVGVGPAIYLPMIRR